MASAYKWRITNTKYAFITDETGGDPFITDNVSSVNESEISLNANKLNEENYSSRYNLMVVKIKDDPDGESMDLPDYRYYYDIDSTSNCATINYGIQGTQGANGVGISNILQTKSSDGINTVTFVLTDGTSYDIYIKDGATGSVGLTGPTGEQGRNGEDAVPSEDSIRRIVNEMNITSAVTVSLDASLGEQYRELLKKYNDLSESYELLASYLSATTITANEAYNKINEKEQQLININLKIKTFESVLSRHTSNLNMLNTVSVSLKESLNTNSANISTLYGFSSGVTVELDRMKGLMNNNIGSQVLLSGFVESINLRLSGFSENILDNSKNIDALSGATKNIEKKVLTCDSKYDAMGLTINRINGNYIYLNGKVNNISEVTSSAITSINYLYENCPTTDDIETVISEITQPEFSNLNGKISDNRSNITTLTGNYTSINRDIEKYLTPNVNGLIATVNNLSDSVKALQITVSGLTRQSGTTT